MQRGCHPSTVTGETLLPCGFGQNDQALQRLVPEGGTLDRLFGPGTDGGIFLPPAPPPQT